MDIIKIGIVIDNNNERAVVSEYFDKMTKFSVEFIAKDGLDALDKLKENEIDLLVLDIILPKLDGLGVLEKLDKETNNKSLPKVIMISAFVSQPLIIKAMELGAAYYMAKPIDLESLSRRIDQLCNINTEYLNLNTSSSNLELDECVKSIDVELKVTYIIHELGVPAHIKGYKYIKDAIEIVVEDPDVMNAVTKELYPMVASKNDTTAQRVERAIRNAIEISWTRGKPDLFEAIFGYTVDSDRGKPTNSEYIALIADKIRLERMVG